MDTKRLDPTVEKILETINDKKNFVLQGAAGSGKTETLKRIIDSVSRKYGTKKIACITYTNLATDEILERVGTGFTICTIHSFLNDIIKSYKKNIHEVIDNLFLLSSIKRDAVSNYYNEAEQTKKEYEKYKKIYNKYKKLFWDLNSKSIKKVIGKRDYDKSPEVFNEELNKNIKDLNNKVGSFIKEKGYNDKQHNTYNESKFDSLENLTFGHDGLLKIACLLFERFPLLVNVVKDKYDFIFIDEYQDTNREIIDLFVKKIGVGDGETRIGLFGDSMQSIYSDRVGNVREYTNNGNLQLIEKEDNYRCSEQVIDFINNFRDDGLKQKVALKEGQAMDDRQGSVKLYYSIYSKDKPNNFSPQSEKEEYLLSLSNLIKTVSKKENEKFTKLMLTNKYIAGELAFGNLYDLFNLRTLEINELIEKEFDELSINELAKLCIDFKNKNYNNILTKINKAGFRFVKIDDKDKVTGIFEELIMKDIDCIEAIEKAFENKFIKKTNSYKYYIERKNEFISNLSNDLVYNNYKKLYKQGNTTATKMNIEEEIFSDFVKKYNKEEFYINLFENKKVSFKELMNYQEYMDEGTKSEYITMHKTKGGEIKNVMLILDEYFWNNEYNFKSIFDDVDTSERKLKNQKLFYVSCSRAIKNLVCVKLIIEDEEKDMLEYFSNYEKI